MMELRNNRNLLLVFGIIVVSIGIFFAWNPFRKVNRDMTVDDENNTNVQYYQNLSRFTLIYEKTWHKGPDPRIPPLTTARRAFYLPSKSLVINVTINMALPEETFLPLVVQDLDAPMIQGVNEFNKSIWISPIIWSVNITQPGIYSFTIPFEGWYVISLCGHVWYYSGTGSLGSRQGGYKTSGWGDADAWFTLDDLIAEATIQVVSEDGKLYDFTIADECDVK
jgi:hypothetical protein